MTLSLDDFLESIKDANGKGNLALIKKAYAFACKAHEGQKRMSGEPFVIHPIEVAKIISNLKLDSTAVSAALLHDVVEDCAVTLDEIRSEFGDEVALLVEGVTKLSHISKKQEQSTPEARMAKQEEHFENLRRIFVAMAKDIRVIIIKLADRLHNLRTLCNLSREKQKFIAKETLEIFTPLAHRLGIWQIKAELEDLAFSYLEPEHYQELQRLVAKRRAEREKDIQTVIETLLTRLKASGIEATIEGRPKHLYSIWQKMVKKGKSFGDIHDLTAVRVLVNSVEDCYATLGIVHGLWMPLHDRIKDYIAKPKSNNYRSLHTTVYGPGGEPLEIQIRTWEMHRVAEYGVAAHWHYKQNTKDKSFEKMLVPWIKHLMEWQTDLKSAKEYVQAFKMDFLESSVFAFTPKGDVIDLPLGSTPLDFAYRVHTDVGHQCVGAKVNGRMVPLDYHLQNGDIVEIITSKTSGGPSWDWLKIVKTSNAQHKIKNWFKKEKREENVLRGKELLEKFLAKIHWETAFPGQSKEAVVNQFAQKSNFTRLVDFMEAVGCGDVNLQALFTRLKEDSAPVEKLPVPRKAYAKKTKPGQAVLVKGVDHLLVRFSRCCNPVPGDKICGYVTVGKGIAIHQESCTNIQALLRDTPERILEVEWNPDFVGGMYDAEIIIEAWDKPGLLGEVMQKVYAENITARSCFASARHDQALIRLVVEVPNLNRLQELMKVLREIKDVTQIRRVTRFEKTPV
jgi:guanosine-3',5'-bis(diphosphate) 3'-pyrophosphohydrolase